MSQSESLKKGTCPKCASTKVYVREPSKFKGGAELIMLSSVRRSLPDVYACGTCGFIERYFSKDSDLDFIQSNWKAVA